MNIQNLSKCNELVNKINGIEKDKESLNILISNRRNPCNSLVLTDYNFGSIILDRYLSEQEREMIYKLLRGGMERKIDQYNQEIEAL